MGPDPTMVTSFADFALKISFEQAIVAERHRIQGSLGGACRAASSTRATLAEDRPALRHRPATRTRRDHRLRGRNAAGTKIYCLAEHPDPKQQHYLNLYKMGEGPLYSFFVPVLTSFTSRRAVLDLRASPCSAMAWATPLGPPVVEVCAVAKAGAAGGRDSR